MTEYWNTENYKVSKENMLPIAIREMHGVEKAELLFERKHAAVSFKKENCAIFEGKGSYVLLDFGKELCGGIRIITRAATNLSKFKITLGESYAEACSEFGNKNAGNDHSPRDFEVKVPLMSDLTFGQSGFRFAKIELLEETPVQIKSIYAVNTLPYFEKEAVIKTSDEELNRILDTAAYTLKLNLQNGFIFDGIKRDRLVWCGDLHQEIINSLYLFGDNNYVTNSLTFLKDETDVNEWINTIPSYSAWWVINLCDYCKFTGNDKYFEENKDYAEGILKHFDECISDDGDMQFGENVNAYFLDWPTKGTDDAVAGTAAIILLAAKKYLEKQDYEVAHRIVEKLSPYLANECTSKQARAIQVIAGKSAEGEDKFLEAGGAAGLSTFMAYYILKADAMAGGKQMLSMIKTYYGAMLSRGATTFWEDFDMSWLEGSSRIDELPKEGERDIHGDYGAYCYVGFRHSLCHGWASGVLAFFIEYMVGLEMSDGGESYEVHPNTYGIEDVYVKLPTAKGWLEISVHGDEVECFES